MTRSSNTRVIKASQEGLMPIVISSNAIPSSKRELILIASCRQHSQFISILWYCLWFTQTFLQFTAKLNTAITSSWVMLWAAYNIAPRRVALLVQPCASSILFKAVLTFGNHPFMNLWPKMIKRLSWLECGTHADAGVSPTALHFGQ